MSEIKGYGERKFRYLVQNSKTRATFYEDLESLIKRCVSLRKKGFKLCSVHYQLDFNRYSFYFSDCEDSRYHPGCPSMSLFGDRLLLVYHGYHILAVGSKSLTKEQVQEYKRKVQGVAWMCLPHLIGHECNNKECGYRFWSFESCPPACPRCGCFMHNFKEEWEDNMVSEITATKQINAQGTSLVIFITKEAKGLGLKKGDWVEISIRKKRRVMFFKALPFLWLYFHEKGRVNV